MTPLTSQRDVIHAAQEATIVHHNERPEHENETKQNKHSKARKHPKLQKKKTQQKHNKTPQKQAKKIVKNTASNEHT